MEIDGASNRAAQNVDQVIPARVIRIMQERSENWLEPIPIVPELFVEEFGETGSFLDDIHPLANPRQRLISPACRVAYI